jgi:nucleoside-diphosphate-sugar epimerase
MARRELHWEPVVTLSEGLHRSAEYFRAILGETEHRGAPS